MLYPLRFEPRYFEKVWGDRRLETIMHRELPPELPIGESWEISDHPHGRSVIANGPERGNTLHALLLRCPEALLGTRVVAQYEAVFPLLIKYIDAGEELSVQVHPSDAYAAAHEGEMGKTEMWYVLHADPGACLIAGLRDGVTKEAFQQALESGDPAALLYRMPVKSGDSLFIPAGRIHAIMPGVLILEIQQSSDTTYRLYDWHRMGLDGKPRTLHIEQALAVANWTDYQPAPTAEHAEIEGLNRKTLLAACRYFAVELWQLAGERTFSTEGGSFYIINCVAGEGSLDWAEGRESFVYGDSVLVPAALRHFTLVPRGEAAFLISYVP